MIRNLSHISLGTNSLEKVYKFYIEKLGLKIVHKFINKKMERFMDTLYLPIKIHT